MNNPRTDKPEQLTEHFWSYEADCHDGTSILSIQGLVTGYSHTFNQLEVARTFFGGSPIRITSGYRTPEHNEKVGGAPNSYHKCERPIEGMPILACAVDFSVAGVAPVQVYQAMEGLIRLELITEGGLGLYQTWVHYDPRGYKSRWVG